MIRALGGSCHAHLAAYLVVCRARLGSVPRSVLAVPLIEGFLCRMVSGLSCMRQGKLCHNRCVVSLRGVACKTSVQSDTADDGQFVQPL